MFRTWRFLSVRLLDFNFVGRLAKGDLFTAQAVFAETAAVGIDDARAGVRRESGESLAGEDVATTNRLVAENAVEEEIDGDTPADADERCVESGFLGRGFTGLGEINMAGQMRGPDERNGWPD